eukprot:8974142-Pyramimonas_sp.AAC.1
MMSRKLRPCSCAETIIYKALAVVVIALQVCSGVEEEASTNAAAKVEQETVTGVLRPQSPLMAAETELPLVNATVFTEFVADLVPNHLSEHGSVVASMTNAPCRRLTQVGNDTTSATTSRVSSTASRGSTKNAYFLGGIMVAESDADNWASTVRDVGFNTVHLTVYMKQNRWDTDNVTFDSAFDVYSARVDEIRCGPRVQEAPCSKRRRIDARFRRVANALLTNSSAAEMSAVG